MASTYNYRLILVVTVLAVDFWCDSSYAVSATGSLRAHQQKLEQDSISLAPAVHTANPPPADLYEANTQYALSQLEQAWAQLDDQSTSQTSGRQHMQQPTGGVATPPATDTLPHATVVTGTKNGSSSTDTAALPTDRSGSDDAASTSAATKSAVEQARAAAEEIQGVMEDDTSLTSLQRRKLKEVTSLIHQQIDKAKKEKEQPPL